MSQMREVAIKEAAAVSFAGYRPHEVPQRFIEALVSKDMMLSMRAIQSYPELTLHYVENILNQGFLMGQNQPADIDRIMAANKLARDYNIGNLASLVVRAEMLQHMKDPMDSRILGIIPTTASTRIANILRQTPANSRDTVLTSQTIIILVEGGGVLEHLVAMVPADKRLERIEGAIGLLSTATQQGRVTTTREPQIMIQLLTAQDVLRRCNYYAAYYPNGITFEQASQALDQPPQPPQPSARGVDIEL